MSSSFLFFYQAANNRRDYNFATDLAEIGEVFLRSPESMGHKLSEETHLKIRECFPQRGDIEKELNLLKEGVRSAVLESIPGITVRYGSRYI